jgi:hypothetical protein
MVSGGSARGDGTGGRAGGGLQAHNCKTRARSIAAAWRDAVALCPPSPGGLRRVSHSRPFASIRGSSSWRLTLVVFLIEDEDEDEDEDERT